MSINIIEIKKIITKPDRNIWFNNCKFCYISSINSECKIRVKYAEKNNYKPTNLSKIVHLLFFIKMVSLSNSENNTPPYFFCFLIQRKYKH